MAQRGNRGFNSIIEFPIHVDIVFWAEFTGITACQFVYGLGIKAKPT